MTAGSGDGPRFLSAADVAAAMPPLEERLRLAERTLTALAEGSAELPPKIAVHPRPEGAFAHAMPAHLRAPGETAWGISSGSSGSPDSRPIGRPACPRSMGW